MAHFEALKNLFVPAENKEKKIENRNSIETQNPMSVQECNNFWKRIFEGIGEYSEKAHDVELTSSTFSSLEDMKDQLNESYKEIKESKPMNSPNVVKWFEKGGQIDISEQNGTREWTYINPEGIRVTYEDGYPVFPPETKHPDIRDLSIGEFTGDRGEDKKLYLDVLEEEYGLTETPEGYALHHDAENGNMQLIKEEYHKEFTHAGGHSKFKEGTEC